MASIENVLKRHAITLRRLRLLEMNLVGLRMILKEGVAWKAERATANAMRSVIEAAEEFEPQRARIEALGDAEEGAMSAKAKGSRRERQARDVLISLGHFVTKSGGSLGAFDLIALPCARGHGVEARLSMPLVQVKSNQWPGPDERGNMEWVMNHLTRVVCPVAEIWRFDDYRDHQTLRLTDDGWVDEAGCRVFEIQET